MNRILLSVLAAATVAAPLYAQADGNAEVRAAASAFDLAQQQGDRAGLERLLAPDFLYVRGSGRIGGRGDYIDGFVAPGVKLAPIVIRDPLFMRVSPDAAIVGGEAWIRGSEGGQPFAQHYRYSETFARRDGRWMVVYLQITALPSGKLQLTPP